MSGPRLPPHIMLAIFFTYQQELDHSSRLVQKDRHVTQQTIITVSQVCSSWRHVVLGENHLWQHIHDFDAYSLPRNHEILELSAPLPFDVGRKEAPIHLPAQPGLLKLLLQFKDRVREWNIVFHGSEVDEQWWRIFASTSLSLEAFRWTGLVTSPSDANAMDRPFRFPMPSLRRLSLVACNLPFHRLPIRNITELYVENIEPEHNPPTVSEWLDVLQATPHLQYLHIHDAVKPSNFDVSTITPFTLFNLRLITIGEEPTGRGDSFALLEAIIPSPMCGLSCHLPHIVDEPYLSILETAILNTHHAVASNPYISDFPFSLCVDQNSRITMSNIRNPETRLAWNGAQGDTAVSDFLQSLDYNVLSIRVPAPSSRSFWDVQSIISGTFHPSVTSMYFSVHAKAKRIPVVRTQDEVVPIIPLLLQNLPNVRSLTFDGDSSFLPIRPSLKQWDDNPYDRIPVLPSLQFLIFRNFKTVAWRNAASYLMWRAKAGLAVDDILFE